MLELLKMIAKALVSFDGKIESVVDDAMRKQVRDVIQNGGKISQEEANKFLLAFQMDADAERSAIRDRMTILEIRVFMVAALAAGAIGVHILGIDLASFLP